MENNLEYIIIGILFGALSYFLKDVIDDVKELKKQYSSTKGELDIFKNDFTNKHTQMSDKFDELKDAMYDLTQELKEFRKDISEELKKKGN